MLFDANYSCRSRRLFLPVHLLLLTPLLNHSRPVAGQSELKDDRLGGPRGRWPQPRPWGWRRCAPTGRRPGPALGHDWGLDVMPRARRAMRQPRLAKPGAELLPYLGNLGADHYLAVHTARVVLVEKLVFPFRRIKDFKRDNFGYHRPVFGP